MLEDDQQLACKIADVLGAEYNIDTVHRGNHARNLLRQNIYNIYIFDIILYDKDGTTGLDICRSVRRTDKTTPILIISGKDAINYKLGAFKAEADDYLCKPFNILELRARMNALLRPTAIRNNILTSEDLSLDRNKMKVSCAGTPVYLRKKEFRILELLLLNKGRVLTRDMVMNKIWDSNCDVESNTVDVHIKNLRAKIDRPFNTKLIRTVYGVGYKIED